VVLAGQGPLVVGSPLPIHQGSQATGGGGVSQHQEGLAVELLDPLATDPRRLAKGGKGLRGCPVQAVMGDDHHA
jgi:hypothetical protein